MSEIDVMYTRTYNGDYLADFDCNADDLPKSNVFFYKAIQADELAALRARIAELEAQAANSQKGAMSWFDLWSDLWDHIVKRLGGVEGTLPNAANFDDMLQSSPDYWRKQYEQLASAVAELHEFESLEEAQAATANRDTLDKVWMHVLRLNLPMSYNNSGDECEILIGGDDMIGLQEAAELIKQAVTQPATLTPRQCNRLCFERGFEAGREAAFNAVDNYEIDVESPLFDAFVSRDLEIMTIIESLTAPSSCGCNPLKPSESDAAMLDEWHKRM